MRTTVNRTTPRLAPIALLSIATLAPTAAAALRETAGTIDSVTVYRGQALVTRTVEVAHPAGLHEVIVSNLPLNIIAPSIHAEAGEQVAVRSVRYRERPVSTDVREEVREIDAQIRALEDQLAAIDVSATVLDRRTAYLDNLDAFVAPTAGAELTSGVLNAETLERLTTFSFDQRETIATERHELSLRQRDLREQLTQLQRERSTITSGSSRTVREAVVLVAADAPNTTFRLSYLVNGATWSPSYTVRAETGASHVHLEYYASVQQSSGENWDDVAMSLSTATPTLTAMAPRLSALSLGVTPFLPQQAQRDDGAAYADKWRDLQQRKADLDMARNTAVFAGAREPEPQQREALERSLNEVAGQIQLLDLLADSRVQNVLAAAVEGVSVVYDIPARTTLPSRSDRQLIQISATDLEAERYRLAIPALTEYVYNEALATNPGSVLLAGPVSTYLDSCFVGRGELPTIATGETFTIGLGIDETLRARRTLVEKKDDLNAGNRLTTLTYRLSIDNFGSAETNVRILDRLPKAEDDQIRITLADTSVPLSTDKTYLETQRPDNILRWDVTAPTGAGTSAFTLDFTYTMEHDKQMNISPLASNAR